MAEQEACAELVEKASQQEKPPGTIDGESLLLPLLQGLLQAPEKEQLADSGTESGEDQRSGLIAEVQNALEKLSNSLRNDSTDISPERRASLLQLVTKLQAGLATTTPKLERRLSSGPSRFKGRRSRQNRHTVGVSSEELADARRLMEEISLHDLTQFKNSAGLQKQNSESSVTSSSSFNKFGHRGPVRNAIAKPFSSSSNSISNASSVAQTPTEPTEHYDGAFTDDTTYRQAAPVHLKDKKPNYAGSVNNPVERSDSPELLEDIESIRQAHKAVQQAAARKKETSESTVDSETEDDNNTVKGLTVEAAPIENAPSPQQVNPIYSRPSDNGEKNNTSYQEKAGRFNTMSKKNKMKRANTIDIPKALLVYTDDDSDTEDEEQRRKNNYYALRGPIRVPNTVTKNAMPILQPKTESDQKFLAFINKNNQNSENKTTPWAPTNKTSMWGNRFGNIKNNFEKVAVDPADNAAKNFWKSQDDAVRISGSTQHGPKISRKSARNLQQMFEEKQRQNHGQNQQVITGSLTLKTDPEKNYKFLPVNKFSHAPQSAFKPIPKKTPSPETDKKEILITELRDNRNEQPLYLYSPKPLQESKDSSANTSPIVTSKPWVANAIEHGGRVISMAAKKFETPPQHDNVHVKPRKLSKEINKAFTSQQTPPEKLTAPYIVKSTEQKGNIVRRLSDQYDNMGSNTVENSKTHYVPPHRIPQQDAPQQYASTVTQRIIPNTVEPVKTKEYESTSRARSKLQHQNIPQYDGPSQKYQPHHILTDYKPVNYSITYDKPKTAPKPIPEPIQIYQHVPGKEDVQTPEYTSTFQFNINSKNPNQVPVQVIEPVVQQPRLEKQLSTESIHEYNAISSKVMRGPISQQAVTVHKKQPMSRDQHDMEAAFRLKNALQKVGKSETSPPNNQSQLSSVKYPAPSQPQPSAVSPTNSFKYHTSSHSYNKTTATPVHRSSNDVQSRYVVQEDNKNYNKYNPNEAPKAAVPVSRIKSKFEDTSRSDKTFGVVKPMQQQKPMGVIYNNVSKPQPSLIINDTTRQGVVMSKFHIPVINVAPSSPAAKSPTPAQILSKSDSWHQICMANQMSGNPQSCSARAVVKSKSSHNLAVPKGQFEAGITKAELQQKKKTIEAYFSGSKSPEPPHERVVKRSINRMKTSEKRSAYNQSGGICRSKTLPDMICPELLDESNIDEAFEDLFKASV